MAKIRVRYLKNNKTGAKHLDWHSLISTKESKKIPGQDEN